MEIKIKTKIETPIFLGEKINRLLHIRPYKRYIALYNQFCNNAFCVYKDIPKFMNHLKDRVDFENMELEFTCVGSEIHTNYICNLKLPYKNKDGSLALFSDVSPSLSIYKNKFIPRFDIYEDIFYSMLYLSTLKYMDEEYSVFEDDYVVLALVPFIEISRKHINEYPGNISNLIKYIETAQKLFLSVLNESDDKFDFIKFILSLYNMEADLEELYKGYMLAEILTGKLFRNDILSVEDVRLLVELADRIDEYIDKKIDKYINNYKALEKKEINKKEIVDNYEKSVLQ